MKGVIKMKVGLPKSSKTTLLFIALLLIFSVGFLPNKIVYASGKTGIDTKLDQQGKDIKDKLEGQGSLPSSGDKLGDLLNQYQNNADKQTSGDFDAKAWKGKIQGGLVTAAITFRKYAIPMYTLLELVLFVLLSTAGAKSLEKRKKYIVLSISFTLLFLFILNIPIIAIYFQNRALEEVVGGGGFYTALYGAINFLQTNSIVMAVLLVIYGVTNMVLSKTDLPRRLQGKYMIKLAGILLLVMQVLPLIIKVII
jgi:hypothetical protein